MKTNRIIMILSLILVLVVNTLANTLPINGVTTGEVSDQFPILFVPAGYVFSIWGLIYLALIAFMIYAITPKGKADEKIDSIAGWFVAANLFNSTWIFLWHYRQFTLTVFAILGLLVSLLAIYLKLRIGVEKRSLTETLLVAVPFSIYLGWGTVATVANISQALYNLGWNGGFLEPAEWTVIMLAVASLLGVVMIFTRKEVAYPLVLVWAFVGIFIKHGGTPLVSITALVFAIILFVLALGRSLLAKK